MNRQHGAQRTPNRFLWLLGCMGIFTVFFVVLVMGGYLYSTTASAASQSVVLIREPNDGEILEAGQPVQVRALARDDNKIERMELWVDGTLLESQVSNIPGGINPFPVLATWYPQAGFHTVVARSFNSRGTSSQTSVSVEAVAYTDRDMDSVPDHEDACPDQPGNPAAGGCPDRDYDAIPDTSDACPDVAGLPEDGCPAPSEGDRDGDGVLDGADACPDEAGSPLADGCVDGDGDGVGDSSDACPEEPGAGEDGCPAAGDDDPVAGGDDPAPGGDPPGPAGDDDPEPGFPDMGSDLAFTDLEIEGYEFMTTNPYESIACYLRLGDEDPRRYEFDSLGDQAWDIAAEIGDENRVRILHLEHVPLQISIECLGSNPGSEPDDLGEYFAAHPREEWDGREFTGRGEGNTYLVRYRICNSSCDESLLPAPRLGVILTDMFGRPSLSWRWDGNNDDIDGFGLSVSTMDEASGIDIPHPTWRSLDISDYRPACGETVHFQLFAYQGDGSIRSPMSNERIWSGRPCEYTANITFRNLDAHSLPTVFVGPVRGDLWISNGSTTETLSFNSCLCSDFSCWGYPLHAGDNNIDRDIFEWIRHEIDSCPGAGCPSSGFEVPATSTISIPFEAGDDLTIGASILDCDPGGSTDVLFEEQESIRMDMAGMMLSGVTLEGEHLDLETEITVGH